MQSDAPGTSRLRPGLRLQLIFALSALAALLVVVIGLNLLSTARIKEITSQTVEVEARLNRLANDVVIYTQLCRIYEKQIFLNIDDPSKRDFYLLQWDSAYQRLESAIDAFASGAVVGEDRRQAETWRRELGSYREAFLRVRQAIAYSAVFKPQDANGLIEPYKGDIETLTNTALTMAELKAVNAQQAEAALLDNTTSNTRAGLSIGGIALLVALAWIWLFPARLMRPIDALRNAVDRLAGGDLSARVGSTRADELGALARGFDAMAATIQQRNSDLVAQRAQAEAARADAEAAHTAIAAQLETIEQQRNVIREMSVPIMPLDGATLVMPLVGVLDNERIRLVQEQALQAIERSSARHLILDISAVPIVDTQVAQGLLLVVRAARLLGAEVVLVGVRPEVAQAVVGLGIQLDAVVTRSSLQSGIVYVQQRD
jgi:rsbT co-antagonist protein RsbR